MKKINITYLSWMGALLLLLTACSDRFLDKEPMDSLVPNTFFNNERDLNLYTNSFYQRMLPTGLAVVSEDGMGDYTSKTSSPQFIAGSYSSVNEPSWNWTNLRNINYFLSKANNPQIDAEIRNHYQGIARFFRAYFYFDKVKTYGDVPWYSGVLGVDDEDLYKGRDSRALVMDSVLADLNFAVTHIRNTKDQTSSTVTRQVALAFKSRVALFEGTFRKYHPDLNLSSSAAQWLREAADAAKQVMDEGQYRVYNTGDPTSDYRSLFTSENPVADEIMWAVVYNNGLRKWHDITWRFNSATYGSRWGLNKQFINTYLQLDGSRFTDVAGFDTIQFVREVAGRDHRLSQTVRSLGYKRSDGTPAPPNFGYTYTGYHIHKFSLDERRLDGAGESYNSVSLIRYAEVLLNYAEAKAELGEMDAHIWSQTIAPLRQRAGVNPAPPTQADRYLQEVYFPEINDAYLLEIRRERGIELVYEGLRYADLLRWKKGHLLEMQWKGIYVPGKNILMDLDGNGTPDVTFVDSAPTGNIIPGVVYYVVDGKASRLTEGDKGHITWRNDENRQFDAKKYYKPISNADRVLNKNLTQNPDWD